MRLLIRPAILKSLAALSINLSSAWFGAVFIFPEFGISVSRLTTYLFFGIVYLLFSIILEEFLDNERLRDLF